MWCRLWTRLLWHHHGILLWLVQRPELRFLPFPYPSVRSCSDWAKQIESMALDKLAPQRHLKVALRKLTLSRLGDCLHLRDRVGFRMAFLEDVRLTAMVGASRGFQGQRQAVHKALQEEIKNDAKAKVALGQQVPLVKELLGPRGGLPSLKTDLLKLATLLKINTEEKETVASLKEKITPMVAVLMAEQGESRSRAGRLAVANQSKAKSSPSKPSSLAKATAPPPRLVEAEEDYRLTGDRMAMAGYALRQGIMDEEEVERMETDEMYELNWTHADLLRQERLEAVHGPLEMLGSAELKQILEEDI